MEKDLWRKRSQNLFIIREIWKEHSGRKMSEYYDLIGINDSDYSAFIKNVDKMIEADRQIEKYKNKIENAGFQYGWFTGEKKICDDSFGIKDNKWDEFAVSKRGTDIQRAIAKKIRTRLILIKSDKEYEFHKVYIVVKKHNPKSVAKQMESFLDNLDLKTLTAAEIEELVKLSNRLEELVLDIRAIKRVHDIAERKK